MTTEAHNGAEPDGIAYETLPPTPLDWPSRLLALTLARAVVERENAFELRCAVARFNRSSEVELAVVYTAMNYLIRACPQLRTEQVANRLRQLLAELEQSMEYTPTGGTDERRNRR